MMEACQGIPLVSDQQGFASPKDAFGILAPKSERFMPQMAAASQCLQT